MFWLSARTSAKTGTPPALATAPAVAKNVNDGTITSRRLGREVVEHRAERKVEGVGARVDGDGARDADEARELLFEALDLGSLHERVLAQDADERLLGGGPPLRVDALRDPSAGRRSRRRARRESSQEAPRIGGERRSFPCKDGLPKPRPAPAPADAREEPAAATPGAAGTAAMARPLRTSSRGGLRVGLGGRGGAREQRLDVEAQRVRRAAGRRRERRRRPRAAGRPRPPATRPSRRRAHRGRAREAARGGGGCWCPGRGCRGCCTRRPSRPRARCGASVSGLARSP